MEKVKKKCNYVMVMDWMYDNFDFNVAEANALGIIYGFCQDGESWYQGGSSYLAARLHISQKSAKNYLADFTKRGILTMKKIMVGNVERNAYQTVPDIENLVLRKDADPGKNFPREKISPVKKFPSDPGKNFPQTREKFSPKKEIEKEIEKSIYQRQALKTDGLMDSETVVDETRERFWEQLELDDLVPRYDPAALEELLSLIVEMYCCPNELQYIGKMPQLSASIRKLLDRLTGRHIEYIMDNMAQTTTTVKNIRAYLQTTILRAATTLEFYEMTKTSGLCAQQTQHPAGPNAEKMSATLRRIQKRGDGA